MKCAKCGLSFLIEGAGYFRKGKVFCSPLCRCIGCEGCDECEDTRAQTSINSVNTTAKVYRMGGANETRWIWKCFVCDQSVSKHPDSQTCEEDVRGHIREEHSHITPMSINTWGVDATDHGWKMTPPKRAYSTVSAEAHSAVVKGLREVSPNAHTFNKILNTIYGRLMESTEALESSEEALDLDTRVSTAESVISGLEVDVGRIEDSLAEFRQRTSSRFAAISDEEDEDGELSDRMDRIEDSLAEFQQKNTEKVGPITPPKLGDLKRDHELVMGFDTVLPPKAIITLADNPRKSFTPKRLVIPTDVAEKVTINKLVIGGETILVHADAKYFTPGSGTGTLTDTNLVNASESVEMTITNKAIGDVHFKAALIGRIEVKPLFPDDDPTPPEVPLDGRVRAKCPRCGDWCEPGEPCSFECRRGVERKC